ncbi:MAG: hypothetical protein ACRYFU_02475 [Janthinobacterium lividum]
MKYQVRFLPVLYGLATYSVLFFGSFPLARSLALFVSGQSQPFGGVAAAIIGGFLALLVVVLVAPVISGWITARTAKERPYLHSVFVFVSVQVMLLLTNSIPLTVLQRQRTPFRWYALLVIVGVMGGMAGTRLGWARHARQQNDELMQTLRSIKF